MLLRRLLALCLLLPITPVGCAQAVDARVEATPTPTSTPTPDPWALLTGARADGTVVLFRHASAPGGGDPPGLVLGDCSTQRNLSDEGRAQARRLGALFREHGVRVGAVWHSQWCRTRDTADLAFPGQGQPEPVFNSFFDREDRQASATAAARRSLAGWRGPGVLVVVTHQVNITALTGVWPQSGEGVVLQRGSDGQLAAAGRLPPP